MDSEFLLSDTNKVFCLVPWTHMHIWPNGNTYLCCNTDSLKPIGMVNELNSLQHLWNIPKMREVRLNMLEGRPSAECERCYEIEKSGLPSMRQNHNRTFKHQIEKIKQTEPDGTVAEVNMPYMDIRFSNICNFRCRTCGPELSSSWFKDAQNLGLAMSHDKPLLHPTPSEPLLLWSQVEEILPTVEQIYFAGGEPLIMEEHYRILNWLIKNGKTNVQLRYNTNFSITSFQGQSVFELWKHFQVVVVGASLDAAGYRAEYMRKETNWRVIESNRLQMMKVCPQVSFHVSVTLSVFSCTKMAEFHRDWVEKGLVSLNEWHINPLTFPQYYKVHILPLEQRQQIMRSYADHIEWLKRQPDLYSSTLERWRSAIAFLEGPQLTQQLQEFRTITNQLDEIRQESLAEAFPELAVVYRG